MRSKIRTQSRLAAHMAALLLLVAVLVQAPRGRPGLDSPDGSVYPQDTIPEIPLPALPGEDGSSLSERDPMPGPAAEPEVSESTGGDLPAMIVRPAVGPADTVDAVDSPGSYPGSDEPLRPPPDADAALVAERPDPMASEETSLVDAILDDVDGPLDGEPAEREADPPEMPPAVPFPAEGEKTMLSQPDESGALLVVPDVDGGGTVDAAPLPNATLEVLGNNVYWLGADHDLEEDLASIPEIGGLIVLASLEGYKVHGFEHVKTEVIPADIADLDGDAAERFLHLTADADRPVVVAALAGARGAAFFKGAYILANRNLSTEEMLREIEPELEEAGAARDDIVHRLMRLGD